MSKNLRFDILGVALTLFGQVILVSTLNHPDDDVALLGFTLDILCVAAALICVLVDRNSLPNFNANRVTKCQMNLNSVSARKFR